MSPAEKEVFRYGCYRAFRRVGFGHPEAERMADEETIAHVDGRIGYEDDWDDAEIAADEAQWDAEEETEAEAFDADAPDAWDYYGERKEEHPEFYAPSATPLAAPADRVG